eukprot:SAG31_NODE_14004_length_832_cov_1.813097_1_plen_71_part_10
MATALQRRIDDLKAKVAKQREHIQKLSSHQCQQPVAPRIGSKRRHGSRRVESKGTKFGLQLQQVPKLDGPA